MNTLYNNALTFAIAAHANQVRKYTGEPYILHPIAVAELVRGAGGTQEMIAAALLHDVVEDTDVQQIDIGSRFGNTIGGMVHALTDSEVGNRSTRKAASRMRLSGASYEVQTIKYADLIDNTRSIVKHDPKFAMVYLQEKLDLLEVMQRGDRKLWSRAYCQALTSYALLG